MKLSIAYFNNFNRLIVALRQDVIKNYTLFLVVPTIKNQGSINGYNFYTYYVAAN